MSERIYLNGKLIVGSICPDCSAYVFDCEAHDKFHDDYKPARKATFITERADGTKLMQFIDGSTIVIDNGAEIPTESAIEFLEETNRALAPFYAGGETALRKTS